MIRARKPAPNPRAHRIPNPGGARPKTQCLVPEPDPELLQRGRAETALEECVAVPEELRLRLAQSLTVRGLYEHSQFGLLEPRRQRVEAGKLGAKNLEKDAQALDRWERLTRPRDWPGSKAWHGLPIGFCTTRYVEEFLVQMQTAYAGSTAASTWSHLRIVFNHGKAIGLIGPWNEPAGMVVDSPKPDPALIDDDEHVPTCWSEAQLSAIYRRLRPAALSVGVPAPVLESAFVVANNTGLRACDLFRIRRSDVFLDRDRPVITMRTTKNVRRKSKRWQTIPLSPLTVDHLRRLLFLMGDSGQHAWVFRLIANPEAQEEHKTRPARRRNKALKAAIEAAGLEVPRCPWHACRSSCNERLESVEPSGAGRFLLGHSLTLNSSSYRAPSAMVYAVVNKLSQPDAFSIR